MIKKIMKASMAALLVAGMTTTAMAEIKPFGHVITTFGQYSSSEKTTAYESNGSAASSTKAKAASLNFYYRSKIGLEFKEGDIKAEASIASRTNSSSTGNTTGAEISYKAADNVEVTMSTNQTPSGSVGYSLGGGYVPHGIYQMLDLNITHGGLALIDHPGIIVKYAINPYMAVYGGLYTKNTLFSEWFGYPEAVSIATAASCVSCGTWGVSDFTSGSGNSLSFQGMLSKQLLVGAAYLTSTRDTYDGRATDSASAMNLTGMYFMGDITLAADYATTERSYFSGISNAFGNAVDGKLKATDMGLSFRMKNIGPGEIGVKYSSMSLDTSWSGGDVDAASYDQTNNHLHYTVPACKHTCKVGFLYESLTKTSKASGADAVTTSLLGGTFAAKF